MAHCMDGLTNTGVIDATAAVATTAGVDLVAVVLVIRHPVDVMRAA